jgi:transposase
VITGEVRRRSWSREEKARITTLSFEPGCNVSALARENGVSIGLLHYWRRVARERMNEGAVRFVPLVAAAPTERGLGSAGVIELELLGARIRITGGVDRAALETVLAAVRASA